MSKCSSNLLYFMDSADNQYTGKDRIIQYVKEDLVYIFFWNNYTLTECEYCIHLPEYLMDIHYPDDLQCFHLVWLVIHWILWVLQNIFEYLLSWKLLTVKNNYSWVQFYFSSG